MIYVCLGLGAVALIAIGVAVIYSLMYKAERVKVDDLKAKLAAEALTVKTVRASSDQELLKREELITVLKDDIKALEKSLAESSTPTAVGDRLDKLFP